MSKITDDDLQAMLAAQRAEVKRCLVALADLDEEGRKFAKERLREFDEWLNTFDIELAQDEPPALAVDACLVVLANLAERDRSAVRHQLEDLFDVEDGEKDPSEIDGWDKLPGERTFLERLSDKRLVEIVNRLPVEKLPDDDGPSAA
jgi:hypothetical protein